MERNVLSLYLSKVAAGDESYLDKLCSRLAERLIYVPLVESGDGKKSKKASSTRINVLKATHGDKTCVPVFTSEKRFKEWCNLQGSDFEVLSLLGVDFAAVVDPDAWLIVDPGSEHSVVLSPDTVDLISQDLFIEVFESEKKMKERAAIELAEQMADVGSEPEEPHVNGAVPEASPKAPVQYEEVNPFAEAPSPEIASSPPLEPDEPPQVIQPRGGAASMEMWQPAGRRSFDPSLAGDAGASRRVEAASIEEEPMEAPVFAEEPQLPVREESQVATLEIFARNQSKIQQRDEDDEWAPASKSEAAAGAARVFSRDQSIGVGMDEVNTTQEFPRVELPQKNEEPIEEEPAGNGDGLMSLLRKERAAAEGVDEPEDAPVFGGARVKPAVDPRARGAREPAAESIDLQRAKRNLFDPDDSPLSDAPPAAADEPRGMGGFMGEPSAGAELDLTQGASTAGSETPSRSRRPTMWQGSAENSPNDTAHRGLKRLREELAAGGAFGEASADRDVSSMPVEPVPPQRSARTRSEIASDTPDEPGAGFGRKGAPLPGAMERPRSGTGSFKRNDLPTIEEMEGRQRAGSSTNIGGFRPAAGEPAATGVFQRPQAGDARGTGKFDRSQIEQAAPARGRPQAGDGSSTGVFNRQESIGSFGASDSFETPGRPRKSTFGSFGEPPEDLSQTSSRPYSPRMGNAADEPPLTRSPQLPPDEISSTHEFAKPRADRRGSMGGTGMNLLEPNHAEKVYFPKDQKAARPGVARPGVFGEVGDGEDEADVSDGEAEPKKKKSLFDFLKR